MLQIGIILAVTGFIALVYGLLARTGHMPDELSSRRFRWRPRAAMIVGPVLLVVGVVLLVVALA